MNRPPSPTNHVAVNLITQQQRNSRIAPIKGVYPQPRRSHQPSFQLQSPAIPHNYALNDNDRLPNFQQSEHRFSSSIVPQTARNSRIIGIILYFIMICLVPSQLTLIYFLQLDSDFSSTLQMLLLSEILSLFVLRKTGAIPQVSWQEIKIKLKGNKKTSNFIKSKGTNKNQQASTSQYSLPLNPKSFIFNQTPQSISAYRIIGFFILSLLTPVLYANAIVDQQISYAHLLFAISIVPISFLRIKTQHLSSKMLILVYGLIIMTCFCSGFLTLFIVSLSSLVLNNICRFDWTLWTSGYIVKSLLLILSLIVYFPPEFSMSSIGITMVKIALILGGILITRQVADNIMRKQLYKYYLADFHLDCSLCLVPLVIHSVPIFAQQFEVLLVIGCIIALGICYFLRNDPNVVLQGQLNKKQSQVNIF